MLTALRAKPALASLRRRLNVSRFRRNQQRRRSLRFPVKDDPEVSATSAGGRSNVQSRRRASDYLSLMSSGADPPTPAAFI